MKKNFTRRVLTVLLSFALVFTCLPLMGSKAEAASLPAPDYDGRFEVYPTYFNYYPFTMVNNNYGWMLGRPAKLYMEYSADGVNWTRTGYMQYNYIQLATSQGYCIGGLQPNTIYMTRIWYGDDKGNQISPVRSTGAVRTGMPFAPSVKKWTAKAVKVKYHRVRHAGYYNYVGGSLFWHGPWTERFYTYKVKVTVQLKQKPGTTGIFINGVWCPGNKKKYTATFSPYPNYSAKHPRGRIKWNINVYSGWDPNYGGYSPMKSKKKKLS